MSEQVLCKICDQFFVPDGRFRVLCWLPYGRQLVVEKRDDGKEIAHDFYSPRWTANVIKRRERAKFRNLKKETPKE